MSNEEARNTVLRQLIELAVAAGRKRKSSQTGYLHHCHGLHDPEAHLPIPIVENFLFALALMRTRVSENINEAKGILEGLLYFQNLSDGEMGYGNFPIYLHEYPVCKDRFTALHAAAAMIAILKQFHQVIGSPLKRRLEKALALAIAHAVKAHGEKAAPYPAAVKVGAVSAAAGRLLSDRNLEESGLQLLGTLAEGSEELSWYCPEEMGEILVSLTLVYPSFEETPWAPFWEHAAKMWCVQTGTYAGPALKEWQWCEEPQATLYDLFLSYQSGSLPARARKDSIVQLEAAMIPQMSMVVPTLAPGETCEGSIRGAKWQLFREAGYAFSCVEQGKLVLNPSFAKGFHPFRMVWGDLQRVHTFVCQDGNTRSIQFDAKPTQVDFDCLLGDLIEFEDREQSREIAFFYDACEKGDFQVEKVRASTFLIDEELVITTGGMKIALKFFLKDGDGRFLGHRMMGNRPAQVSARGASRYNVYDWQLFLRTVRRSEECRIGVRLTVCS